MSSTAIHLSWTPPIEDINGIIREYHVKVHEMETSQLRMYSTVNSFITVQSLHPFYTYRCAVSAFTVATGPFANFSVVMLPEDGKFSLLFSDSYILSQLPAVPSGYPQNFRVVGNTSRSVDFQWEPPLMEDQNGIITMYTIMQMIVLTGDSNEYVTNSTHMTVTDLTPHATYVWTIAASTSVGRGPYSTALNHIMPEEGM